MKKREEVPPGLLETLGDFTSKENWDNFFSLRGAGDSFEWYAEWSVLRDTLLPQLSSVQSKASSDDAVSPPPPHILVPGCGSSRVSEHLYDAGFRQITNIDFSKIVISDMLRRNIRSRPEMRWRVMDMTDMQLADESFDFVLDKGGLDALMEPEAGSALGSKYLKEVKRILKPGGRFLCLTLAESHVLGLLFNLFRFGWKCSIHAVLHKTDKRPAFQTFMVVFLKEQFGMVNLIESSFDLSAMSSNTRQAQGLIGAIKSENHIREGHSSSTDVMYSLRDLELGAQGNLQVLQAGRRCQLILGGQGDSLYSYKTVLLDAQQKVDPFLYYCGVFIAPQARAREWLFSSEVGQWQIVESSKAARLIMVFLDSSHSHATMEVIQKDLSPLVKSLAPLMDCGEYKIPKLPIHGILTVHAVWTALETIAGWRLAVHVLQGCLHLWREPTKLEKFMMASDGVKQRKIVRQATSKITGPMVVEDVIYENNTDADSSDHIPSENKMFRRLIFERSSGLVQSEALLISYPNSVSIEADGKQSNVSSISRKKGGRKRIDSSLSYDGSKSNLKIDHSSLASSYHSGIISGFSLAAAALENAVSLQEKVRVIIIGLGAGLLPMFLHTSLPFLDIKVVELDPFVLEIAKDCFGFKEDTQLRVHIGDGIKFIQNANSQESSEATAAYKEDLSAMLETKYVVPNGQNSDLLKILIVDADSSDLSSGLACPPSDFVEESFLLSVKDFLSVRGLFVINLVSRSSTVRQMVVTRLKAAFSHLFSLELEEDVNEVLFASTIDSCFQEDHLTKAVNQVQNLLKVPMLSLHAQAKTIKRLK